MQTINLYKFTRPDGGVTVSTTQPEGTYTAMYRLVANEGKALTQDGVNTFPCVDVENPEGWREVADYTWDGEPDEDITADELMTMIEGVL